jgi:hypothetical protein
MTPPERDAGKVHAPGTTFFDSVIQIGWLGFMSRMPANEGCAVIPKKLRDPRELRNVCGGEIFIPIWAGGICAKRVAR